LINTSLWYHETAIPPTDGLSFSYARDFRMTRGDNDDDDEDNEVEMDNLDDVWATAAVPKGTVIATGKDIPDGLGVSQHPTCKIEQGRSKIRRLVAARDIEMGESLTIQP